MSEKCPKCGYPLLESKPDGSQAFQCWTIRWADGTIQQTYECGLNVALRDAARYRFIRDRLAGCSKYAPEDSEGYWFVDLLAQKKSPTFDAAIDSMMEQQEGGGA